MKDSITFMNKWKKTLIILLWLAIWQITATAVHNSIMLVGPIEALQTLWDYSPLTISGIPCSTPFSGSAQDFWLHFSPDWFLAVLHTVSHLSGISWNRPCSFSNPFPLLPL